MIEEKIPLKQGLKPDNGLQSAAQLFIEEKIPLKQGLKQNYIPTSINNGRRLKRRFH